MTIFDEKFVSAKIINPINDKHLINVNINIEIKKVDIFLFKRLFYMPIRLTYCLYSFIPVHLDNKDINISY